MNESNQGCFLGGFLLMLALLAGCAPYQATLPAGNGEGSEPPIVGTLRVIGPDVRLNGVPARDGATVYNGSQVSTGENSSAYVYFTVGGYIHLDENTDPVLDVIWQQTQCIIRIIGQLIGQSYVETDEQCVKEIESPHGEWTSHTTRFNLQVRPQQSVLTVLDGRMALVRPHHETIDAHQQMSLTRTGVALTRRLSPRELRDVVQWRRKFPAPEAAPPLSWCCVDGEVYEVPREVCLGRNGTPYGSFDQARRYCRMPEPALRPVWCCANGQVFGAPRAACLEKGGQFYESYERARQYCRPVIR